MAWPENYNSVQSPQRFVQVDPSTGLDVGGARFNADGTPYQPTYQLAGQPVASLAAGASLPFATNVTGGSYVFDAQFAGTSPSLQLQALGADGATYRNVGAALTAPGSSGVVIGQGATLRLTNTGAGAITGISANLT